MADDASCVLACRHVATYARATWHTRDMYVCVTSVKRPFYCIS